MQNVTFPLITGRQKTTINRKFLEEHGGLQADMNNATNEDLEKEIAKAKQMSDMKMMEEMSQRKMKWQAQKDQDFIRGKRRFLTNKERDLVLKTFVFDETKKHITFDDIRKAVAENEEFREMFEELVNSEYGM